MKHKNEQQTPSENQPDELHIMYSLLRFFSTEPSDQQKRLKEYIELCVARMHQVHVHHPLVELAEGLAALSHADESVRGSSPETGTKLEEVGSILELILDRDSYKRASPESLDYAAYWRVIRRLCNDTLLTMDNTARLEPLSVWDMLCMVSD
jgi:hypothetical protein